MLKSDKIGIIFNCQVSESSMGGGDKIVLNIAKQLGNKSDITFFCCPEGEMMAKRELGKDIKTVSINNSEVGLSNFIIVYLQRILNIKYLFSGKFKKNSAIWSSSDFLPDVIPGFLAKIIYRKKWYSNLFLRARNPFLGELQYTLRTILYFLSQQLSIFLSKHFADVVFVLSKNDQEYLIKKGLKKVAVLSGGVDLDEVDKVKVSKKIYDACYVGRFHYQKGLPVLLKVWSKLCKTNKGLKLAIVGWGIPEEVRLVNNLIKRYKITDNVELKGYLDGTEKYKIIKESKILLFPSSFESWGVVIAEGIACGTPVIAFDLPSIINNFSDGVVWVKNGNIKQYRNDTEKLLNNRLKRINLSVSVDKSRHKYDWKYSAEIFMASIK